MARLSTGSKRLATSNTAGECRVTVWIWLPFDSRCARRSASKRTVAGSPLRQTLVENCQRRWMRQQLAGCW